MSVFCREIQCFRISIAHLIATSMPVCSSTQQMLAVQNWRSFKAFLSLFRSFSFPRPGCLLSIVAVLCRLTVWCHAKKTLVARSRLITFYVSVLSRDPMLSHFNSPFNCHIYASMQLHPTNACCPKLALVQGFPVSLPIIQLPPAGLLTLYSGSTMQVNSLVPCEENSGS